MAQGYREGRTMKFFGWFLAAIGLGFLMGASQAPVWLVAIASLLLFAVVMLLRSI